MNIFLNSDKELDQVAELIFKALGINHFWEGDSRNVLEGVYNSHSIFGINIKLELNAYDYEDEYKFMLHVKKDMVSPLKVDSSIENNVASIVLKLLYNNLDVPMAIEKRNELLLVSQDNIFEW